MIQTFMSSGFNHLFSSVNHAPPAPVQGGGSLLGGIGSTIAQGMAFGTGSAVAYRAVDTVLGPRTIQHETAVSQAPETASAGMGNAAGADVLVQWRRHRRKSGYTSAESGGESSSDHSHGGYEIRGRRWITKD